MYKSKYNIVYKNPEVSLIDFNHDDLSMAKNLWMKSRESILTRASDDTNDYLNVSKVGNEDISSNPEEYCDRVIKMGLQYTNFPNFTFEVKGSTLFRDILFIINKNPAWSTSLRFVNSTFDGFNEQNYPISSEYKDIDEWTEQIDKYFDKIHETSITDENRMEMPYCMWHTFWVQMNWKTLIGFLSMLKLKMPFFYEVYGTKMVDAVNSVITFKGPNKSIEDFFTPYIDSSIQQYFFRKSLSNNVDTLYIPNKFNIVGDQVVLRMTQGMLLLSQFMRQQDSKIKGFYDILMHDDVESFKHKMFYSGTPVYIEYSADYERFMRTISNRTCWFSMSSGNNINSWSSVLDLVLPELSLDEFESLLPCRVVPSNDGNHKCVSCKYHEDVKFRCEGIELRNPPCGLAVMERKILEDRNDYDKTNLSKLYLQVFDSWKSKGVHEVDNDIVRQYKEKFNKDN